MPLDATALVGAILVPIAALLPIVNPLGSAPLFLSMSADLPADSRYVLARKVAWSAFLLLAAAMLIGSHVLAFFGISLPIVRVGGGLLVTANGWRMLQADEASADARPAVTDAWEREVNRRAFYPLTFPLTVGPGSVTVAITLGARVPGRGTSAIANVVTDLVAVAIVALIVYLSYRFASRLIAFLGETGTNVFVRLSSFILLCVGVSIVWSGLLGLIEPLLRSGR
jgi:multiple antibiotic resistance protein